MNALRKFLAPQPPEYGLPEEGFLAPKPEAFSWRVFAFTLVVCVLIPRLARAAGVPEWVDGLVIAALGLFFILNAVRRRGPPATRRQDIICGSALVGIGAALSYSAV